MINGIGTPKTNSKIERIVNLHVLQTVRNVFESETRRQQLDRVPGHRSSRRSWHKTRQSRAPRIASTACEPRPCVRCRPLAWQRQPYRSLAVRHPLASDLSVRQPAESGTSYPWQRDLIRESNGPESHRPRLGPPIRSDP